MKEGVEYTRKRGASATGNYSVNGTERERTAEQKRFLNTEVNLFTVDD